MNALLVRELAIQLRAGAAFDDAHAFIMSVQQQRGSDELDTILIADQRAGGTIRASRPSQSRVGGR